jgi:hypothetical protein
LQLTVNGRPVSKEVSLFLEVVPGESRDAGRYQIVRLVKTGKSPWKPKLIGKLGATRKFIIVVVGWTGRKVRAYQIFYLSTAWEAAPIKAKSR